jgi:hypothetical protein
MALQRPSRVHSRLAQEPVQLGEGVLDGVEIGE